jgi:hypothetical protein
MIAALLYFPLSRRISLERWKLALDAAMVLVGGVVLVWFFAIRPTAAAAAVPGGLVETLLAFAYPLADLLLLLAITTVLLRGPARRQPARLRLPRGRHLHQHRRRPHLRFGAGADG